MFKIKNSRKFNNIAKKTGLLVCAAALTLGVIGSTYHKDSIKLDPKFDKKNDYYNGSQVQITDPSSMSSSDYITMTAAKDAGSNNGKTITIESSAELNYFATICSTNTTFLSYNYVLISNIEYDNSTIFTPVGYNGTPFSGTFDGQGYEISGLTMTFTSKTGYDNMDYYSMFSEVSNEGTITNLGLISPKLTTTVALESFGGEGGVSYLVGKNSGTVSNCFVVDDGDALNQDAGLAAAGGCRIADLCVDNTGSLTNNYVVTSSVVNIKTTDYIEFAEIALKNTGGTLTNNYYFNNSIETYSGGVVTYKEAYGFASQSNHTLGTYCSSASDLVTALHTADSTWYIAADYGDLSRYVGIDYAVRRGLTYNNSTMTFTIANAKDYAYMYELFNEDDYMASNAVTYQITANINLALIPISSYTYTKGIGATITGTTDYSGTPTLANNSNSSYPTIYNANVMDSSRIAKSTGVDCYGLFNYLTGTVSNLNIVPLIMDLNDVDSDSNNVKGVGVLSGYIEGGSVNNVNIHATIKNSANKNIGEHYIGGLCGILGGEAKVSNVTTAGSMTFNATSHTIPSTSSYMQGIAIGGVVGYIESSSGALYTCLNAMNITCHTGTSTDYAIGGVIGAGYTMNYGKDSNDNVIRTSQLENVGSITACNSTYNTYSTLYVAGIIGRHFGMIDQVQAFTNNGSISVYSNGNETYVAGVENADILASATANTHRYASQFKNNAGNTLFYASAFTNGGQISVTGVSGTNLEYTNVLNIKASNGIVSQISGIYNLSYYQKYDGSATKDNTAIADQSINMSTIYKFSGVLNVVGGTSTYTTSASTIYNLRNIVFTTSAAASNTTFKYSGVALGDYISYEDARNEGNLTFTISYAITGNIYATGICDEISSGMTATNILNNGDITVKFTAIITGNVYASGICYAHRNGFTTTEIQKYNPSSDNYDKSLVGTINNTINAGEILVTSNNFSNATYSTNNTILSYNNQSYLGNTVDVTLNNAVYINGDVFTSGITSINESVITNTFNVANITAANYIVNKTSTCEVNAAGISILNIGQFSYIMNCANDGDIKSMNVSSSSAKNTIDYLSEVNAAGISCRNDELEDGTSYSGNTTNPNSKQVISFTINYGSVYSYNYRYNITSTSMEPTAKSAGILAMGLCNVINVVNYANIYGSETASGIFGIVYFTKFTSEVSSNIYIANTLNYGNIYILERGYNHVHGSTYDDYEYVTYSTFMNLTIDTASQYALTSVVRNTDYLSIIGSIFSIVNFGNASNYNKIVIRYLISFDEAVAISGAITGYSTGATPDVSTFYSAHISTNAKTGAYETDTYMGKYVQYSPLISSTFTGTFVTNIDTNDNVTTASKTYNGVFSNNFAFMQAIAGNSTYIDTTNYKTDIFISDYFEFIGAVYANSILLDKIGWSDITYSAAAEAFATSLDGVAKFITHISALSNTTQYNDLITAALSTDTWISKCNDQILLDLTDTLIENEDSTALLAMLDYIFTSSSSSYSMITTETRTAILEAIIAADNTISYSELLDALITYSDGYSSLLGDSVLSDDSAGTYLKSYINSLGETAAENILTTYCNYLKNASTNSYFSYKNSEQLRYDLLNSMFENIDDDTFYQKLAELIEIDDAITSATISDVISMYEGYSSLTNAEKIALYQAIILNNTSTTNLNQLYAYITGMASEIDYFSRLIENGYSKTSLTNIYRDVSYDTSSESESVIDERIALWNQIRKTTIFEEYMNNTITNTIYAKATEYNNTYQSITEPHNSGAYLGDTDNRLSYLYTTDITPEVYFYGPYTSSTGAFSLKGAQTLSVSNIFTNQYITYNEVNHNGGTDYYSLFHYSSNDIWNSDEYILGKGGTKSNTKYSDALTTGSSTLNHGILMYYDLNNEQLGEAAFDRTVTFADNTTSSTFKGFSYSLLNRKTKDNPAIDPVTGLSANNKTSDWSGVQFGKTNDQLYVESTGETISLNNAKLTGIFYVNSAVTLANGTTDSWTGNRVYIQDETGSYHPLHGIVKFISDDSTLNNKRLDLDSRTDNNNDNTLNLTYSYLYYLYGLKYYSSTVNTSWHSTGRTGIYRRSQYWSGAAEYFTWKQKNNNMVYTSQYIDYSVDDLLNLDGYLTEYNNGTTKSSDERDIINMLFNTYFVGDSTIFSKVVAAALLERNMYDSSYTADLDYIDDFFTANIYSSTTISGSVPLAYIYQSYTNSSTKTTVKEYLMSKASSSNDYKSKFIAYCTSNQSAYAKLLLELMSLDANTFSIADVLAQGEGSSGDTGAITIDNISSYSNLYFVNNDVTINSEDLEYGMKFTSLDVTLDTDWKKIYLCCYPTNTSGTINVALDSNAGTDYTVTTSYNNYIEVTLNNNSVMHLTSTNSDVIIYKILVNYTTTITTPNTTDTYTYTQRNTTTTGRANRSITLLTANEVTNQLQTYLDAQDYTYSNLVINSYSYVLTGYNSTYYTETLGISNNVTTMLQEQSVTGGSTYQFSSLSSSYAGTTLGIFYYNDDWWSDGWEQDSSYIISKSEVVINYTFTKTTTETVNTTLIDSDSIFTIIENNYTNEEYCNKLLDESTNYSTKYNSLLYSAIYGLLPIDYSSTLNDPTHTGTASKNIIEILGLNETHDDSVSPEYCVPEFLELFITSSNSAFKTFIDETVASSANNVSDYEIILKYLVTNLGYYSLSDAIKNRGSNLSTTSKRRIAAAYLVSDYSYILSNNTSISNSLLKTYIDYTMDDDCKFINSNNTYDNEKFTEFCSTIGYDLSTAGYGIYALSSNQGKLNGQYIPDNLDISTMDDPYATDSTLGVKTLRDTTSNAWRGGALISEGTVNYAFYKDMKQIEQSISTAVFELSINYGGNVIYGNVDLDEKTVTYYVSAINTGTYSIQSVKLAHEATSTLGSSISVTSATDGFAQDSFTVTAENTSISSTYSIIFKLLDVEFSLTYDDDSTSKTVQSSTTDTTIVLNISSTSGTLPEGLDLEPYISFVGTKTYTMSSEYLTLSSLSTDHIVDANGAAIITIVVSYELPAGTYAITVSICGNSDSVEYIKVASTGNSITKFGFDGSLLTIATTMNSTIPFGRAYDYSELTDYTASNFYLYAFEYSPNAKVRITAEKNAILLNTANNEEVVDGTASTTLVDTGRIYYKVTYTITSESGSNNTYYHYLKESSFFDNNTTYADIYAGGDSVGTTTDYADLDEADRPKYLSGGTFTYLVSADNYISSTNSWSLGDDMFAQVSFNRGLEPQYRIKYNLSNFYTLGDNVVWAPTAATLANGATVNNTYAGLTVTVSDNNDTGKYTFVYTYTNTGTWVDNESYTRYYEFPEFIIEKLASTDALLHQLTFLEESIMLGNTATVIVPSTVIIPDESDTTVGYSDDDQLYDTLFTLTTRDIVVSSKSITYNNDTDAKSISDYYSIGTVSEADLSYYCPTFSVNDYAQIYQYTTYAKLTGYGIGAQTKKDENILSNHETLFLYVPYNNGTADVVLLVEVVGGYWTNVYTTDYNGNNSSSTKLWTYSTSTVTTNNAKTTGSYTVGSTTYTVCSYAGEELNNQSLYMDYVGTPLAGHFWYVSYVIFSEDNLLGNSSTGNVRYYHISVIDATNTIQFNVNIYVTNTLSTSDLADIYLTISENIYDDTTLDSTRQISAHAVPEVVDSTQVTADSTTTTGSGCTLSSTYNVYSLKYSLQTLPKGYFYFYVDLPNGYVAKAYTDMPNQIVTGTEPGKSEEGAFLPFTSIITQKVALDIVIDAGTAADSSVWAVKTSDIYTVKATYTAQASN